MNKKIILAFLCCFALKLGVAQSYELLYGNRPASTEGPVYVTEPWVFTPTTKSGDISMVAEFTSQVYTDITQDGESGLMFGVRNRNFAPDSTADNKYLTPSDIYDGLGTVGMPVSTFFSENIENIGEGLVVGGRPTDQNGAILHFASVEGIAKVNNSTTKGSIYELGTVKYIFSKPVTNPIIHISGLGGRSNTVGNGTTTDNQVLRFTSEMELISDYTMERLSGSTFYNDVDVFDISPDGKKILNTLGDDGTPITGDNNGTTGNSTSTGSAIIYGKDITEVEFLITMRAKTDGRWTQEDMYAGDAFTVSFSFGGICTAPPKLDQQPEITKVGISTLNRNAIDWLNKDQDNRLGAYLALESSNKPLAITRNVSPGLYQGDEENTTIQNVVNPVEGMIIWDDTKDCLSIYQVNANGEGFWKCTSKSCNQ